MFQVYFYVSLYFYNPKLTFTKLEIKLKSNSSHSSSLLQSSQILMISYIFQSC